MGPFHRLVTGKMDESGLDLMVLTTNLQVGLQTLPDDLSMFHTMFHLLTTLFLGGAGTCFCWPIICSPKQVAFAVQAPPRLNMIHGSIWIGET